VSFTQDFFTSRRNQRDGNTRIDSRGRLWYDHNTNTIRIGDGVTPGGIIVGAAEFGPLGGTFGSIASNVASLQSQVNFIRQNMDPAAIDSLTEIVNTFSNVDISVFSNLGDLFANAAAQQQSITSLFSNAESQQTEITGLWANAALQHTNIDILFANAASQFTEITNLWTNAAVQQSTLNSLAANAVSQQTSIDYLLGNALVNVSSADASVAVLRVGGNIDLSVSAYVQENIKYLLADVRNVDTVTITKGTPVYLFAATGNRPSVKRAQNTSDAFSAKTLGLAAENIGVGQTGLVMAQGLLVGVDTGAYAEGDTIYLGATAGSITNVKPYAPNHLVYLGVVVRANQGQGEIYVRPQNGYELHEIHDVNINHNVLLADQQILVYNASNQLWENRDPSVIILPALANISGNIIPSQNVTYDLGTPTLRWRDLYLAGQTIDLGGATISKGEEGIAMPTGSTIGGINPGTIVIKGARNLVSELPTENLIVGDGYIVDRHLYVYTQDGWVDVGVIEGPRGSTGATGPSGTPGIIGATGTQGATGPQGLPGEFAGQGATGATGEPGSPGGATGATGPAGTPGTIGIDGATGATGIQGNIGPIGATGPAGTPGTIGIDGATGATGIQGNVGPIGATGLAGTPGTIGIDGATGATGIAGIQGNVGPIGATGSTGPIGASGPEFRIVVSDSVPTSPTVGTLWWDSTIGTLFFYYDDGSSVQWVSASLTVNQSTTGLVSRTQKTATTSNLANNATANVFLSGFKGYNLYAITSSHPAWIRLYTSNVARINDYTRTSNNDPTPDIGVVAEVITVNTNQTVELSPAVVGYNNDSPITPSIPMTITNLSGGANVITVSVTLLQTEI